MIKKALVALLSSAILATTVVSGVVTTPTVAYAEETKVIKITRDDCISADDTGYDLEAVFGKYAGILKAYDADVYFLEVAEYRDDESVVYPLNGSAVIETSRFRYTISYDGTSYEITDLVDIKTEEQENKKAKYNKWISDMVVCKHQSAGNVTLSASEKKGTLTVTKADIRTATKLDMMLKSKKALTVKIKASSKTKAVNQFKSLRECLKHANEYGIMVWLDADQGIPYTEKVSSYKFKKSGSFYTVSISKSISKNYTYLCEAYRKTFKRAAELAKEESRESGEPVYDFAKSTHLCDCSDAVRLRAISGVILRIHGHQWDYRAGKMTLKDSDRFKSLAGNTKYNPYVCEGLAHLSQCVGFASGFNGEYCRRDATASEIEAGLTEGHAWVRFYKIKDSSGKSYTAHLDNAYFGFGKGGGAGRVLSMKTWGRSKDILAIGQILTMDGMQWG